jgi:ribosomal protein S25
MALRKKVKKEIPKVKPMTSQEFCKEHGIGGCCANAVHRVWEKLRG